MPTRERQPDPWGVTYAGCADPETAAEAIEKRSQQLEAATCFLDPQQVSFFDPDHSADEDREILIGHSNRGRLLVAATWSCTEPAIGDSGRRRR